MTSKPPSHPRNQILQKACGFFSTWTRSQFESELTDENIQFLEDYVDALNGVGSQITLAIRNTLASDRPSIICNAYHVHELHEAMAFAERGFEFSRKEVDSGAPIEALESAFHQDLTVHLSAVVKHCTYLQTVAADQGLSIELGTLMRLDFLSRSEDQETLLSETPVVHDPTQETAAARFLGELFAAVPQFFAIIWDVMNPNCYLMRHHGLAMQAIMDQK